MIGPRVLIAFGLGVFLMIGCSLKTKVAEPVGHPWFGAARLGDIQSMEKQVAGGVSVDTVSSASATALHVAAFHGNVQVVKWLIDKGADVNKLDIDQSNALGYALTGAARGPKLAELVETLIKAGGDPFHPSTIGFVPVEGMVERGLGEQLRLLSFSDKKQCDRVPSLGRGGMSLSQIARKVGHIEIAEFLEAQGCW